MLNRTWLPILVALLALACGGGSSPSPSAPAPVTLQMDTSAAGTPIPAAILGVNTPWTRLGDGIMQGGGKGSRTDPSGPWASQVLPGRSRAPEPCPGWPPAVIPPRRGRARPTRDAPGSWAGLRRGT